MIKNIRALFFLGTLSIYMGAACAASPLKGEVSAHSAILINMETGSVLYEKNAHTPLHPASITKIATALYALEKKGDALDELVMASHDAVGAVHQTIRRAPERGHPPYRLEFGGTHMGIKAGEIFPLRTLVYGLMLESANDAANVIAQYVSGTVPQFLEELNAYIKTKGCANTVFHSPHGLPYSEHKTTAYDMATITQEAMKFPFFRTVVKTLKYPRGATNKQPDADLFQHNALIKHGKFHYPKAIGVKTGYTLSSGYTLVAAAEDENRKLIAVLLGCQQMSQCYMNATALFDAAFNEVKAARTLFSKEFDHFSCTVKGARKNIIADLPSDLILHYYPSEEPQFTTQVRWSEIFFPVTAGDQVGEISALASDGKILAKAPLFAVNDVDSTFSYKVQMAWGAFKIGMGHYLSLIMLAIGLLFVGGAFYFFHYPRNKKKQKRAV